MDLSKAKKQAYNSRTKTYIVRDENGIIGHSPEKLDGIPCTNEPDPAAVTDPELEDQEKEVKHGNWNGFPDPRVDQVENIEDQDQDGKDKTPDPEPVKKNDFGLNWWE